ncbi:50S ribosomal protein L4 [Clostridium grantii]|uniref:Large ribosomal subunit protein uL4 n=1 Tax=Clostridium grantii DSM 8605 TaxID=1121316 RepID=A0A1M5TVR7_9CLOT|nr:50S ribosomal protein L4 [Clostridium grantii]SHH54804.1 LSU ribosomal protein L4P [Clostridium grantii DSM 8605]
MPVLDVFNTEGSKVGTMDLNETVFAAEIKESAVHQVVVAQLANKRQGNQSAKTRSEVSGGGRKPWRQKGTGRARQGSTRSPQWVGGGMVFAPKPREYRVSTPKSMRKTAMKSVLSSKVNENEMILLEGLTLETPKTKTIVAMINALNVKKPLIVVASSDEAIYKSVRNIENADVVPVNNLNVYDILKHGNLVVTKEAIAQIEEVYA